MSQHEIDIQKILDEVASLSQGREKLLSEALSSIGAYIHEYTVFRKYPNGFVSEYRYAKWKADKPIFKRNPKPRSQPPKRDKNPKYTSHQHIGRVWSMCWVRHGTRGRGSLPNIQEPQETRGN